MINEEPSKSLSDPQERIDQVDQDCFIVSYHWTNEQNQHTFLYLNFTKKTLADGQIFLVQSNVDSSEVKGQGQQLWLFMVDKIDQIAKKGINNQPPLPIVLEIHPNQYSRHLVESQANFHKKGDTYYGLFQ